MAVIQLDFDPIIRFAGLEVRVQTVLLALILLAGLLLAARIGHLTPRPGPYVPAPGLRLDDLPFLVLGIVPGAVIGGRLEAVVVHADYYRDNPGAILDPATGNLGLALGILGGVVGGLVIARLIAAPARQWMHAMALPLLFVLAAGKIAAVLGAEGQGLPSSLPWATAYVGPGPWESLAPGVPSHPAQVYEAIATGLVLAAVGMAYWRGGFARQDGTALFAAIGQWAVARAIVASTWRDATVLGPLKAEQLILGAVVLVCIGALVWLRRTAGDTPAPVGSS